MLRRSGAGPLPVLRVAVAARGASTFAGPLLAACGSGSVLASSATCRLTSNCRETVPAWAPLQVSRVILRLTVLRLASYILMSGM